MEKYINILRNCPLFNSIDNANLIKMLKCLGAKIEKYEKEETIIAEGNQSDYICIVLSGLAQISQIDYYGNRSILSNIEKSQIFNEAFACAKPNYVPVSVVANEPCEVMFIDCNHILHTCANGCGFHHQLIYNLMKELATKTIQYYERIESTSKRTTREKLLAFLSNEARKNNTNDFYIPFDRQELADYLEVDRSGLSAEISKLRNEGVIECRKNNFKIL